MLGNLPWRLALPLDYESKNRQVICFRFDRTESSTITTNALWCVVAHDLAHLCPSVRGHILEDNKKPITDRIFEWLIERPLSTLGDVLHEELPVIVIDALDECGGLRHDSSGRRDYEALLRTLKHWVEVEDLKKFKLVITSRPEDRITQTFPDRSAPMSIFPLGMTSSLEIVPLMTSMYFSSHDSTR